MSLDSFNAWMAANPEWLGLAIFLIAFLECAAIVGIVLPGVVLWSPACSTCRSAVFSAFR